MELVNYVFHKVMLTWGESKYKITFSDEKTLADTKRDWAKDILTALRLRRWPQENDQEYKARVRQRVDDIFTDIRLLAKAPGDKDLEWPSLKNVTGYMSSFRHHACHRVFEQKALPDKLAVERSKAVGSVEIGNMKSMFSDIE